MEEWTSESTLCGKDKYIGYVDSVPKAEGMMIDE